MSREGSCGECYYWDKWFEDNKAYDGDVYDIGFCLRMPPTPKMFPEPKSDDEYNKMVWATDESHWPSTKETQWCGEFRPKKPKPDYMSGG